MGTVSGQDVLNLVDSLVKKEFDANRRILPFDEYLMLLAEQPERQLRGSAQYLLDMLDHYGRVPVESHFSTSPMYRFKMFDHRVDNFAPKLVGQEEVQTELYNVLRSFVRQGMNNRMILLHGPNGSSKTTLIHALMGGLERYSELPEGASYTFNWVFPVERYIKGSMGLQSSVSKKDPILNFARLPDEEVAAHINCELKDHPILLLPSAHRRSLLENLIGAERTKKLWERMPTYLSHGDLCHRCKEIFEALLTANSGDYKRVLAHIQVERFYFSRRYRNGLVTVEPQLHVDAHYNQLTYNKSMGSLPASLQSLNLFSLRGELIEGNRGLIEYSDLLKRPVDSFKYLLIACETGAVNVGSSIAYLDTIMLGSSNELQLDAFKEFPDFSSFKARIELIRVPYLLSVSKEREIYSLLLQDHREKHVTPHVDWTMALWAVLTRLKKPNSINYPPNVSTIISNLTPLEKAKLYDTGEMPGSLTADERKLLRSNFRKLRDEYTNIPYYEGRMGASVREMKTILYDAIQNSEFSCLSPLSILKELEDFVKRVTEYEFLKQDVKEGFHDAGEFINVVRNEYLDVIDREVRSCIGLYDSAQWEDFLRRYVIHVSHLLKKEKIQNPITGKQEEPDHTLISEFERIVDSPKKNPELDAFRQNLISQVGAWSLDHANQPVVYSKVFPEYWIKLEKHYYESQKALLVKMQNALQVYGTEQEDPYSEGSKLARQTVDNMKSRLGYCEHCAKEVIGFLMRKRN